MNTKFNFNVEMTTIKAQKCESILKSTIYK